MERNKETVVLVGSNAVAANWASLLLRLRRIIHHIARIYCPSNE